MKQSIIVEGISYTFADYFRLNADIEDLLRILIAMLMD